MRKVPKNEIVESFHACPYCMGRLAETWHACCGEAGHGETAYILTNGDTFLASEVVISPKNECKHEDIKLTGRFEIENLECRCGFKIPF